jgi:hypothetical protein
MIIEKYGRQKNDNLKNTMVEKGSKERIKIYKYLGKVRITPLKFMVIFNSATDV